jgi:hypothetical protein
VVDAAGADRVLVATSKGQIDLEGLTFSGGNFSADRLNGASVVLSACSATASNCIFRNTTQTGTGITPKYGGSLYVSGAGAVLTLTDCLITNNACDSGQVHGLGAYFEGDTLTIRDCVFDANVSGAGQQQGTYGGALRAEAAVDVLISNTVFTANGEDYFRSQGSGGALYLGGAAVATLADCVFSNNYLLGTDTWARNHHGGALYAANTGPVQIRNSRFDANRMSAPALYNDYGGAIYRSGGLLTIEDVTFAGNSVSGGGRRADALYLTGAAVTARVSNCTFDSAALAGNYAETIAVADSAVLLLQETDVSRASQEGLRLYAGSLAATNLLVYGSTNTAVRVDAGTADLVNATLAGNGGWGLSNAAGTVTLRNSIIWGNTAGSISGTATVTYSDIEGGHAGTENISTNPLFADAAAGDYHLQSRAGRWSAALSDWVLTDAVNSPCIDAGDDDPRWQLETEYNGRIINLGRYGGTAQASRTFVVKGSVLIVR